MLKSLKIFMVAVVLGSVLSTTTYITAEATRNTRALPTVTMQTDPIRAVTFQAVSADPGVLTITSTLATIKIPKSDIQAVINELRSISTMLGSAFAAAICTAIGVVTFTPLTTFLASIMAAAIKVLIDTVCSLLTANNTHNCQIKIAKSGTNISTACSTY